MRSFPASAANAFIAGALVLVAASSAFAADPVGPPIGNNKYKGTLSDAADRDDFTGRFFRGDVLTVTVTAAKAGKAPPTLKPVLTLVDPDGIERIAGIVTSPAGTSVTLKNFPVDKSGLWAARISGAEGTAGDFLVTFKVVPLAKLVLKNERLGDDQPFSKPYDLPGFLGAFLTATATYTAPSQPVEFRTLTDPDGNQVMDKSGEPAVDATKKKGRTLTLSNAALGRGPGTYQLRVGIPTASATYTLSISLKYPARPKGTKQVTLPSAEPTLDAVTGPIVAKAGETIRITGTNFSAHGAPKVLFGATPATKVTVGGGGTTLDVVVPVRANDAVVPVYVANPDGQGMGRDLYFAYLPAPVVSDLVDATTAAPVRVSPALGGRAVRLLGENFENTHTVTVGNTVVKTPNFVSATEIRFNLPAAVDSDRALTVSDRFGRSGTSAFTVKYKTPPSFSADPYSPGAVRLNTPTTVTIYGATFQAADQLFFAGQPIASTFVNSTTRTFGIPALAGGSYTVRLVDSIGTPVDGPALVVKGPPTITAVTVTAGPVIGTKQIPLSGGSTIQVDGTEFATNDFVTVGGTLVTNFISRTATRKEFLAPAGTGGLASVTVTDGASQMATASDALQYVGFLTVNHRMPTPSAADDYSAIRGAAGDLDRDGLKDDVVLVSPRGNPPGSQARLTRVLIGDSNGVLTDTTTTAMPPAYSDKPGVDSWDGNCVAIGDLDGANGPEIVVGGEVAGATSYNQVRLFKNDGTARFSLDTAHAAASRYNPSVTGVYLKYGYYKYYYTIYGNSAQAGTPQALALGDLDNDGDLDVVVGADLSQTRQVYIDPKVVNFASNPPSISSVSTVSFQQYLPATRILTNQIPSSGKLVDVSTSSLPSSGTSNDTASGLAAFHCRDLALADLNRDGFLDIVVAWDDPLTVSHYGQSTSLDLARTATRVLLNSSKTPGTFTDVTSTWMPATSSIEYWQADRLAFADLDGDGDQDLVLLSADGVDAWLGSPTYLLRALRVLRNDATRFTDVTTTAVPAVDTARLDDWRGDALAIRDVDGDGRLDLLVSTRSQIANKNGTPSRRLRFFRGVAGSAISFTLSSDFQEPVQIDSGEADDLLFVGDLGGAGKPVLLLLGETKPTASPSSTISRAEEWKK